MTIAAVYRQYHAQLGRRVEPTGVQHSRVLTSNLGVESATAKLLSASTTEIHGEDLLRSDVGFEPLGYAAADLTPLGSLSITEAGTYEGLDISGDVSIDANIVGTVTLKGCRVRYGGGYLIHMSPNFPASGPTVNVEHCEVDGLQQHTGPAIILPNVSGRIYRTYITGSQIGAHIRGPQTWENVFVENLYYTTGSHNSSLAHRYASGVIVKGCRLLDGNSWAIGHYSCSTPNVLFTDTLTRDCFFRVRESTDYQTGWGMKVDNIKCQNELDSTGIKSHNNVWSLTSKEGNPYPAGKGDARTGWVNRDGCEWGADNRWEDGTQVGTAFP